METGAEIEARGEWRGGEESRQLGKGAGGPSPEESEGGLNIEERQEEIMPVSRMRPPGLEIISPVFE